MPDNPDLDVRVTRHIDVSPERVFDAWTDPAFIGRWMFKGEEIVRMSADPRVGGRFSFVVRRKEQDFEHAGEYLEFDRPTRLAFTWAVAVGVDKPDESRLAVDITSSESGSDVAVTHTLHPAWADFKEHSAEAWTKMLNALAEELSE
jgi:uncharacterized protein YndB with AHSA1/START domain